MPTATSSRRRTGTRVLVVRVNPAVGTALAQRLMDADAVTLAGVPDALDALAGAAAPDVVVLCPYLGREERASVLAACERIERRPAVVELADEPGANDAHVRILSGCAGESPLPAILAALALPSMNR
jgi:CheY-like chemotaxis protein